MVIARAKNSHIWDRDPYDWYVEPYGCSAALFGMEHFDGAIWDPACGFGRIVQSAQHADYKAFGSDLIDRADGGYELLDFFEQNPSWKFHNIVSNPPFGRAEEFVRLSLAKVPKGGKVAMLLPLVWLTGFSSKRDWLPDSPLVRLYPISPRPSMPPGKVIQAGIRPGNGTKDFAWFVWQSGSRNNPEIKFMNTNHYKSANIRPGMGVAAE